MGNIFSNNIGNVDIMIEIKGVTKSYGDLQVLKGVDLVIPDNKVVAIVGASGAGKSTLLHILGTLDTPDSGYVSYDGVNVTALKNNKLSHFRNKNVGFVFQFHHLLPEFTAWENVAIPAWISGRGRNEGEQAARALLKRMGLENRAEHRPSELSGGEQQRVAVARALVNNPKVVLADEPSGNLDSDTKRELHELFFRLRDELGQTFVIVTHDNELAQSADICLKMRDGIIANNL